MAEKPVLEVVAGAKKPVDNKSADSGKGKKGGGSGGGAGGSSESLQRFGDYLIKKNMFYQVKGGRDGGEVSEFPLCNFIAKIIEEVKAEDGLTEEDFFRIEGRRFDGATLEAVDVPIKTFASSQGNWPIERWGSRALVHPGAAKKDNLRACIQIYSTLRGDIPRRVIYKYTGWKRLDEHWHYLSGGGSISEKGLENTLDVELGAGNIARYRVAEPLKGAKLLEAVESALLILNVCPAKPQIGAALLAAVARAPLGECSEIDFAIWLHGLTGSRKSAVAAIAQAFFGDFTAHSFPSNWSDSVNDAEMKSHQAKDGVFVIDDFKPSVSKSEADKLHAMAERLIRNTGNGAGRGRRGADMQAKAAAFNRSMMLVTAEDLPRGQSLLGRLLVMELGRLDVDNAILSRLQDAARNGLFIGLMASYLQWLAPRMDKFKDILPGRIEEKRNEVIKAGFAGSHPRAPDIYASLAVGALVFMGFLNDIGANTETIAEKLIRGLERGFLEQGEYQDEQDETQRFFRLLQAALSSGDAHIANRIDQGPPQSRPNGWGWNKVKDFEGKDFYKPAGDCIGYWKEPKHNELAEVWLQQEAAFKKVQEFARASGEPFLISASSLWRRMHENGLLLVAEKVPNRDSVKTAVKRTVAGVSMRLMIVSADLIAPAAFAVADTEKPQ